MNINITRLAALAALTTACAVHANEQPFAYSYLSETLPAKAIEVEQTTTFRTKKSEGTYRLWQSRTEFEYGVYKKRLLEGQPEEISHIRLEAQPLVAAGGIESRGYFIGCFDDHRIAGG